VRLLYLHDLRHSFRLTKAAVKREEERIRSHPWMAKHVSPQMRRKLKIAKLDRVAAPNSGATPGERGQRG
jgi:hypothetical protein